MWECSGAEGALDGCAPGVNPEVYVVVADIIFEERGSGLQKRLVGVRLGLVVRRGVMATEKGVYAGLEMRSGPEGSPYRSGL